MVYTKDIPKRKAAFYEVCKRIERIEMECAAFGGL